MVVQSLSTTQAILPTSNPEYHVDIPWNSVPSRGFRGAPLDAKY
jgi:hypothetical protein